MPKTTVQAGVYHVISVKRFAGGARVNGPTGEFISTPKGMVVAQTADGKATVQLSIPSQLATRGLYGYSLRVAAPIPDCELAKPRGTLAPTAKLPRGAAGWERNPAAIPIIGAETLVDEIQPKDLADADDDGIADAVA